MAINRETLGVELRQIILADRMAADVIQKANDTRKFIEKSAEEQLSGLEEDARRQQAEMEARVKAEQQKELDARRRKAEERTEAQRRELQAHFDDNRDAWIDEIVGRTTAP